MFLVTFTQTNNIRQIDRLDQDLTILWEIPKGKQQKMTSKTKVAIVTGGGSGIGKACVLRYAREGYKVGIIDITDPDNKFPP